MSEIKIACVILTLNEEINIERCINSLHWVDDIVVLDSGSSDRTIEIARKCEARTFEYVQSPPFKISEQRNFALNNCGITAEWILYLDADETIPLELASKIRDIISSNLLPNAYRLTPRYLFWGKWLRRTQGYPNWHDRLVKRGEVCFEGGVWEHFSQNAVVGYIDVPYDHNANSKGFSDWLNRHDRYSSWDSDKIFCFLNTRDSSELATTRKYRLRLWAARLWPLRPWCRFFYMFILRAGFLEGWKSFMFCMLYFFYEFMTVVKIIELKRLDKKKPL
jgi:glycosyltransferase involved in cell wall biosynthesis